MKFFVSLILTAFLSFGACLYLPWWSIAIASFLVAALIPQRPGKAFLAGFTALFLLWGGLTTNLVWCMILNTRNKTFNDYGNVKTPLLNNYLFSAAAGTTWFLQFFFYGMGESKLGNGASSWILHMAFIILIANGWGFLSKEWKGVSTRTRTTIAMGIFTIIVSVLLVGYGNSIK